jgi:hypothetical protein
MGLEIILVLIVAAVVLLFLWRAMRFFVRIALIGILILFLFLGGIAWWYWSGPDEETPASRPASRRAQT